MKNNKEKVIKSGVFLAATALVLVVATVAWFISGSLGANTDSISGEVATEDGYGYLLLEAVDTDKNGVLDPAEAAVWVPVPGENLDITSMVPNEYHYYKAVIQTGARTTLQFKFTGIAVTVADPTATEADVLGRINVRFSTLDDGEPGAPLTGGAAIDTDLAALLGEPAAADLIIYTLDLTDYQNTSITIYYDVGIYQDTAPGDKSQGSSVSISAIQFTAT